MAGGGEAGALESLSSSSVQVAVSEMQVRVHAVRRVRFRDHAETPQRRITELGEMEMISTGKEMSVESVDAGTYPTVSKA